MIPFRNAERFLMKAYRQPKYALSVMRKRLAAYLYYYLSGKGESSNPEAVTFFLTHRCNLRCKMCGQWGEGGVSKKQPKDYIREELSFDEFKTAIDDIASFKPNITLFGGEPLLYKNCLELISYIKKKGMHCLMITNASLVDPIACEIVESGLDELNVSLDGGTGLHDEIRGMTGLFDKITSGLKKINFYKKQKGSKTPLINLQCTITKYNYKQLDQMLNVAKEIEANSLTFHNLIFLDKGLIEKQKEFDKKLSCSSLDWEGFVIDSGIDALYLVNKRQEIKKMHEENKLNFAVDFYPNFSQKGIMEYYNNPSFLPSEYSPRCVSAWMTAYVFPDGEVRPCLNFDYSFGNIKGHKFSEIWNSLSALNYRKTLKKNGIFPVCIRCTELYRY